MTTQSAAPILTTNLIVTLFLIPLCVTLLGKWLTYKAEKYVKGWQEYNKLREINEEKFKQSMEANQRTMAEAIKELKENKVDKAELAAAKKLLWTRADNHYHLIECGGEGCNVRRTGEVVLPIHHDSGS